MEQSQHILNKNTNAKVQIRNFKTIADINFASRLTSGEKWHAETETELKVYFENDPEGCFIAEINGELAGICIATNYRQVGFIGDLIVSPMMRNMGIGKSLMENAINYLDAKDIQNIFLDGVRKAVRALSNNRISAPVPLTKIFRAGILSGFQRCFADNTNRHG